jgi:hypothetical protein
MIFCKIFPKIPLDSAADAIPDADFSQNFLPSAATYKKKAA